MKLIKKIEIILKETFLSPRSTSIVTEEGSKITIAREHENKTKTV